MSSATSKTLSSSSARLRWASIGSNRRRRWAGMAEEQEEPLTDTGALKGMPCRGGEPLAGAGGW